MDWDEEFAIQDFLKNELEERNCQPQNIRLEETADKLQNRAEEDDTEERWTVVDTACDGGVLRDTSTPLSAFSGQVVAGDVLGE